MLPITEYKATIQKLVSDNDTCIITGETGSGKSTQICQFLNQQYKRIVVTQPRRVAAVQMAQRVSYEMNTQLGREVGYTVRFEDKSSHNTQIRFVTDGILVRQCQSDPYLDMYDVIILDEAHERSLNTDILFALCKRAVRRRPGLKLVITSATLKTSQISEYYNNCPVLSVSGRCYPVNIMHKEAAKDKRVENCVGAAIRIHLNEPAGDILAFLTGFDECEKAVRDCFEKLQMLAEQGKDVPPMMLCALYGSQRSDEQANAFVQTPEGARKIIFATNIAETSLTVDNIGYVIDCGFVKQKQFNAETGMDSLVIVPISKVQAVQRAGRAGRTREGKCLRLYSEEFYDKQMPNLTVPEIKRVNLTSTVLTLKSMGIQNVVEFDFLDRPDKEAILSALKQLFLLEAIDKNGFIKQLGLELAKFPVEPKFAKALLAAQCLSKECAHDCAKLLAVLSTENIWMGVSRQDPQRQDQLADAMRSFKDPKSDHASLVRIFDKWKQKLSQSEKLAQSWCYNNCIQHRALVSANSIFQQLKDQVSQVGLKSLSKYFERPSDLKATDQFRYALSIGFYMNTCRRIQETKDGPLYITVQDGVFVKIDRKSNLRDQQIDYLVFTQLNGYGAEGVGVVKQASEIDVDWVRHLIPMLKDGIDTERLSGIKPVQVPQPVQQLEQAVAQESKEDKLQSLKERYNKRQKK